jgi:hypothetical protein
MTPRDLSNTITKIRHQHVTYESNNSTIGKNIFTFHMSIVSGNIQNRQEKKRKKMDKAFVDLNLVLYGTFTYPITAHYHYSL